MSKMKSYTILPLAVTALATAGIASADVTLSGQINRLVANVDNGATSNLQFLDGAGSGTRFRLKGATKADNGLSYGFYWETQYQSNSTSKIDASTVSDVGDARSVRHRDLWFKGGFGKVSLGQGNGAANGITEIEFTGTNYITGYASTGDMWSSVTFRGTNTKVGSVMSGFDALSRNDRLRYDTPKLGPVTLSVDIGTGGKTEAAVRFSEKVGSGKLKGGFGTWDQKDAGSKKGTGGSIAYLDGSGFNAAYAFGNNAGTGGAKDAKNTTITLGYKTGVHFFDVRLGNTSEKKAGVTAKSTEFGYVNRSLKGVEMYAAYQTYTSDEANSKDISIVFAGTRIKF